MDLQRCNLQEPARTQKNFLVHAILRIFMVICPALEFLPGPLHLKQLCDRGLVFADRRLVRFAIRTHTHMPRPSMPKGAPCSHRGAVIGKWPSCWPCYEFAGSRHHISIEDREHHFFGHFDRLAEFCERLEFAWNAPQCYQSQYP